MTTPKDNKTHRLTDMTVEEVSLVDRAANKWAFILTKRDEDGVVIVPDGNGGYVPTEKAVWTAAYVNTLNDSAFLYIKPGGQKDETGRTVPRANRMFPYKDATGKVDLPHLRNAIARIPQANIPQDVKDRLQAKARALLERATKNTDNQDTSSGESTMTIKIDFTELAKTAPAEEFDKATVEKQVGAASAKLNQILGALALDPNSVVQMDKYDLRHAVGDAVNILIQAAKLELMLGQAVGSHLQMQAKSDSVEATETATEAQPEEAQATETPEAQTEQATVDTAKFNEMMTQFGEMIKEFKLQKQAPTVPSVPPAPRKKNADKVAKQLTELASSVQTLSKKLKQQKKAAPPPRRNGADVEEMNKNISKPVIWEMDMAKSLDEDDI
jgi:hypothetical protein